MCVTEIYIGGKYLSCVTEIYIGGKYLSCVSLRSTLEVNIKGCYCYVEQIFTIFGDIVNIN